MTGWVRNRAVGAATAALWLMAWPPAMASAEEPGDGSGAFVPDPWLGPVAIELRGGAQSVNGQGATIICAEIRVLEYVGVESCGAGPTPSNAPETLVDMSHYRVEGTWPVFSRGRSQLRLQAGLGFAEIQVGADEPGFLFGEPDSPEQTEGAGLDTALSAKFDFWPSARVALTSELAGGTARIPAATAVFDQAGPWVSHFGLSVGARF